MVYGKLLISRSAMKNRAKLSNQTRPRRELLVRLNGGTAGTPSVSCVIADGIMSFAQRVAEEMGIPALVFWTTSACGFMGYLHFADLVRRGYVPFKGMRQIRLVMNTTSVITLMIVL
jgi:hypothetical protein